MSSLKSNQFSLGRQYSDSYALLLDSKIYVVGVGSAVDVFEIMNSSAVWLGSKSLASSNAWNSGATTAFGKLLVAGPFESSWASPTFTGTYIGVLSFQPTVASQTYVPFPQLSGYDSEVSADAYGDTVLVAWRQGFDLVFRTVDARSLSYSSLYTVRSDSQNGNLTIQNPMATLVTSSLGAVAYEEQSGSGHDYNLSIFSTNGRVLNTKTIFSDTTGDSWAGQVDISSDGNYIATAFTPNNLSQLGDSSGSGVLVAIFDPNGNELSRFLGNSLAKIGDQRAPQVTLTGQGNVLLAYTDNGTSAAYLELYSRSGQFLFGEVLTVSNTFGAQFTDGPNGNTLFTYTDWMSGGVAVMNIRDTGIGLVSEQVPGSSPNDITPPTLLISAPADNTTNVSVGNNITLTFSEAIQKGTGSITIRSGSATGPLVETFDAATSNRLTFSGSMLTIDPTNNLANSTQYFVVLPSGSVRDLSGNNFAGTSTYDFTTAAQPLPTYQLNTTASSFDEGSSATFALSTTNLQFGTVVSYSLSGVSSADVVGGSLSGSVNVGSNGQATISVPIAADNVTEGPETLTVSVQGQNASVVINDTSKLVSTPTYTLTANSATVAEGSNASFTVTTTNVASGTSLSYSISGVSSADLGAGSLSGTTTVGSNGQATISIPIVADNVTEGPETLTVSAQGQNASVVINDKSWTWGSDGQTNLSSGTPTYSVSASSSSVYEGSSVSFTVVTTNVASGTNLPYAIYGVGSLDVGVPVSGTIIVGSDGRATITVPITSDNLIESPKTLTLSVQGRSSTEQASVVVNDMPTSPGAATYSISFGLSSVDEGGVAYFRLFTTNVNPGTAVAYTLSGVSPADIVGGVMSGTVTVGTNGQATIPVSLAADNLTEGTETLTVTAQGKSVSVTLNDTSTGTAKSESSSIPQGNYTLNVVVDLFGQVLYLKGLRETVASTSHTVEHAGTTFNWSEVDSLVTTVTRDGNFTEEFAQEIADVYPSVAGISYSTAVALVGASAIDSVLIAVAGADGNYVG